MTVDEYSFPTLAQTLEQVSDPRAVKDIVRGLLSAAADFEEGEAPDELLVDLRFALSLDSLGEGFTEELGHHLSRLTPTSTRN